jgi:phenylacetate-CoA ligase
MMTAFFDDLERRAPEAREADLFARLPAFLEAATRETPGLARWLDGVDLAALTSRQALARLPVLRKAELMEMQAGEPPFGGFAAPAHVNGGRIFMSPGPIWEPQGLAADPAQAARAFFAAGVRPGDIVHNAFSYHMTPGGFMLDHGARALGCAVFPAGTGNTEMQVEAAGAEARHLCRHAGFPESHPRPRAGARPRSVVDPHRAGLGRGAVSVAARGIFRPRREGLSVLRHGRVRRHRL